MIQLSGKVPTGAGTFWKHPLQQTVKSQRRGEGRLSMERE
jgi:hypothetical protein